ncbi:hypothetical protein ABBQ38_013214 [Trebouxia sp. C0009 RCD-2024]
MREQCEGCSEGASSTQTPGCVTTQHVGSVIAQQAKSSMLDTLQGLQPREKRLLMLVHQSKSSHSYAPVQDVGSLFSGIQCSEQWRDVKFESVYRTVLNLVQQGLLLQVNKGRGPAMEVRLGVAPQEVEDMLRTRPKDIPLY